MRGGIRLIYLLVLGVLWPLFTSGPVVAPAITKQDCLPTLDNKTKPEIRLENLDVLVKDIGPDDIASEIKIGEGPLAVEEEPIAEEDEFDNEEDIEPDASDEENKAILEEKPEEEDEEDVGEYYIIYGGIIDEADAGEVEEEEGASDVGIEETGEDVDTEQSETSEDEDGTEDVEEIEEASSEATVIEEEAEAEEEEEEEEEAAAEESGPELSAYWGFDEGSGVFIEDSSGNEHNGILNYDSWADGISGSCIDFNGETYAEIQDSDSLNPEVFTIMMWLCPTELSNLIEDWDMQIVLNKGWRWGVRIDCYHGTNYIRFFVNPNNGSFQGIPYPIAEDRWIHIACVYSGSEIILYINGKLIGTLEQSGSIENPHSLFIGAAGRSCGDAFYGYIDEVRLYGSVLTQEEIQASMEIDMPRLVLDYNFEDGLADDGSMFGNDGIVNGCTVEEGVIGDALSFDGSSYIEIPNSDSLDVTKMVIVEAWIYPTDIDPDLDRQWIVRAEGFGVFIDNGWIFFSTDTRPYPIDVTDFTPPDAWLSSAWVVEENEWSHVAGVYDGGRMYLYINGKLVASREQSGNLRTSDNPAYIGSQFYGYIDEVRIYNQGDNL